MGRYLAGRRVGFVGINVRLQAKPRRRKRQHSAKLSATEYPDRSARRDRGGEPQSIAHLAAGASETDSVCLARHASSFVASSGSPSAKIAAACQAAFLAPLSPMAKVATGTPPGLLTIVNRLSRPRSALDSTGTSSTST